MPVSVTSVANGEDMHFNVVVEDGAGQTSHSVTMSRNHYARLSDGAAPDAVVRAAFAFLLDREPKESILGSFDISVIARYFPEFETRLPDYLARA